MADGWLRTLIMLADFHIHILSIIDYITLRPSNSANIPSLGIQRAKEDNTHSHGKFLKCHMNSYINLLFTYEKNKKQRFI